MALYTDLCGELKKRDIDRPYLAEQLGVGQTTLSKMFNGKADWTLPQMYKVMDMINRQYEDLYIVFPPGGKALNVQPKKRDGWIKLGDAEAILRGCVNALVETARKGA